MGQGVALIANSALAGKLASMERRLELGSALRGLDDGLTQISAAPAELSGLRTRGWPWLRGLEGEVAALASVLPTSRAEAVRARDRLVAPIRQRLAQIKVAAGRPGDAAALAVLNQALFQIDRELVSAERALEGSVSPVVQRAEALRDRLVEGQRTLDRFADAGFRLPSGERALLAFDVRWLDAPAQADPAPGVLLLSDQRTRFERRDDRVLRRNMGGLAIETRLDRTLLVNEAHASLAAVRDATAGLVRREARVALSWRAGALAGSTCTFALDGHVSAVVAACEAMRLGQSRAYA